MWGAGGLFAVLIILISCRSEKEKSNLIQPEEWFSVHPRPVYNTLEKAGTFQEWFDVYKLTGDHFFPGPLYAYPQDVNIDDYITSNKKLVKRIDEYDSLCSGHNSPWVKSDVLPRVSTAFETIFSGEGNYSEDKGLRRYYFEGFDILIREDMLDN